MPHWNLRVYETRRKGALTYGKHIFAVNKSTKNEISFCDLKSTPVPSYVY